MKNLSNLDLVGNHVLRGGFEVVDTLPTTNLFVGRKVCYGGKDYIYNGSAWTNDADTLGSYGLSSFYGDFESSVLPILNQQRTNLGNPSVFEAAVINSQFTNKVWFFPISHTTFERSDDDITYNIASDITDAQKRKLFGGAGNTSAGISIPKGQCLRITLENTNNDYCCLNMLYLWYYACGDTCFLKIEKYNLKTASWSNVTDYQRFGSWPAHTVLRHTEIPFANYNTAIHFSKVRITIKVNPDTSGGTYPTHILNNIEWCGGYPAGRRTIYSNDSLQNVYFPASVQSNETVNCDVNNVEPTQTGSAVVKTSSWWRQYLVQTSNFLWVKLKDLFTTNNNNFIPKIDYTNKKLVKSNISDDGSTLSYTGNLDLRGNQIKNGGFEVVDTLPTTNLFVGRKVCYNGKDYTYDGSNWKTSFNKAFDEKSIYCTCNDYSDNVYHLYNSGKFINLFEKLNATDLANVTFERYDETNSIWNIDNSIAGIIKSENSSYLLNNGNTYRININNITGNYGIVYGIGFSTFNTVLYVKIEQLSSLENSDWETILEHNTPSSLGTPGLILGCKSKYFYPDTYRDYIHNMRITLRNAPYSESTYGAVFSLRLLTMAGGSQGFMFFDKFRGINANGDVLIKNGLESNETVNCDVNNVEPTQTGTAVVKTSSWWRQYLVQTANFLWVKFKDLFSTNNDCYIPKIDNTNKKLVKSNISDDGSTLSYTGNLDLRGNQIKNAGFEVVDTLPTTNLFVGRKVCYGGKDYMYNGSLWVPAIGEIITINNGYGETFCALENGIYTNKLWCYDTNKLSFENSQDGVNFTTINPSLTQLKKVLTNYNPESINCSLGTANAFRITIEANAAPYRVTLDYLVIKAISYVNPTYIKIESSVNGISWDTVINNLSWEGGYPGQCCINTKSIGQFTHNTYFGRPFVRITISYNTGVTWHFDLNSLRWYGRFSYTQDFAAKNTPYDLDYDKNVTFPASVISNETINCDVNNIEPTQTGSAVTKTSSWWKQYLVQTANFLWVKFKDLFSTNNDCYIPKIDNTNKKLVKSNINDDGTTPKYGTNTIWHSGNMGSGSGLDADLLDGQHASAFALSTHSHNFSDLNNKPSTLLGYGITDAKITNGVITLGSNTITPLTSLPAHTHICSQITDLNTVSNLTNYYLKTETYTQAQVNNLISQIVTLNMLVVTDLPTSNISTTTIYLKPKTTAETNNIYNEYIYINSAWELIGDTTIDLSNYYNKTEIDDKFNNKQNSVIQYTEMPTTASLQALPIGTLFIVNNTLFKVTSATPYYQQLDIQAFTTLPTTYKGNQIQYNSRVYTWNGTAYKCDADTVDGQHASAFALSSHTHTISAITDLETVSIMGVTKLKDTQVDLNHFCSHGSVNKSGLTVAGTYYLKICDIDTYFNNYNQRITVDVSFVRGGSHCNALRFDIIKDDLSNFYINQIGGNIFSTLWCITAGSVIIGTDGYLYLKAKITQCNQFACHVNVYTQPSNGVQYKIDISGLSNSNISATAPAIRKEFVLMDNCVLNSDDQYVRCKGVVQQFYLHAGNPLTSSNYVSTINTLLLTNTIIQFTMSVTDVGSYILQLSSLTNAPIGVPITIIMKATGSYDFSMGVFETNSGIVKEVIYEKLTPNGNKDTLRFQFIKLSNTNIIVTSAMVTYTDN